MLGVDYKSLNQEQIDGHLIFTAHVGNLKQIEKLIGRATIDACTKALRPAAQNNQHEVLKRLLRVPGINVNAQDDSGYSALMWACICVSPSELNVELLLKDRRININQQNKDGHTALMLTTGLGRKHIVELLLKAPGININIKDNNGMTAYKFAKKKKWHGIVKLIENKIDELALKGFEAISAYANTTTEVARKKAMRRLKSVVMQIGADIEDQEGNTFLDKAFASNCPEIIEFLLQNSEDPRKLLARMPFESISPSTNLFEYFVNLGYGQEVEINKTQNCKMCRKNATQFCSKCKHVYYCSTKCQKKDWQNHKSNCE